MDAQALSASFASGEEESLAQMIELYGQPLLRYCHHILCDYHEAQDAVQITFCKAWERRTRCRTGALPAWLYRMAYTTCVDILRQRKRWRPLPPAPEGTDYIGPELRTALQALSPEECRAVLERETSGVLALSGDGGWPYAVPLSYVYADGKIYFHSAKSGHKVDAIRSCPRASFCVIDQDHIVPEEYTTYFRSVIAFGTVRILEEDGEKRAAIEKLAVKYAPADSRENRDSAIDREWAPLCMLEMEVEHLSGKEAIELVRQRES